MKEFFSHAGKLIQYRGWNDQQISPVNSVNNYTSVRERIGGKVTDAYRADYQRYEPILYGWPEGKRHYWCGDRNQGDIWFIDKPHSNDLHPTMKPVELVEQAIENSSPLDLRKNWHTPFNSRVRANCGFPDRC